MNSDELKKRTQKFALDIIKLASKLSKDEIGSTIKKQIVKAGTSVGANYRTALRGKYKADFIIKSQLFLRSWMKHSIG